MLQKHFHTCELNHLHNCVCIESLGKTNISEVKLYQCKDIHSDRNDIIQKECYCNKLFTVKKILKKEGFFTKRVSKGVRDMLLNEFYIGYSLNDCVYIRRTYDIDLIDNCIIFEYCKGLDFFEFIKKYNNLSENLFYFKQLAEAVSYIHSKGVAHMDLKLENVMIDTTKKQIKVIDFGDAKIYKRDNVFILGSGVHGTYEYMAPEIFKNAEYNPEKADIWSIGIIFYELFYNGMPWNVANDTDSNYVEYEKYFMIKNTVLPCMNKHSEFLKEMLNPLPEERCDINTLKNLLAIS